MLIDHYKDALAWAQRRARERADRDQAGEYIRDRQDWAWYVTITSRSGYLSEKAVKEYLREMETAAGRKIGWVLAFSYGNGGDHAHCHLLVSGVDHLDIDEWQDRAVRRFGISDFRLYDKEQGAAFYIAKNGYSERGRIEFGGGLLS